MREIINKNIKWIMFGLLMLCFVVIAVFIGVGKIEIFDSYIYSMISKLINPTMTSIVKVITNFADPIFVVIFALVFSYIVGIRKKDKKTAILFCLNLVIVALLNYALKNIFMRTRPELINIIKESGYSFPSGHSSISVAMYGYLIYLINTRCDNKKIKILSTVLFSVLISIIGLTRIYLGVHFASDVIAAFLITLSYLIIYTHITNAISKNKKQ